MEKKDMDRNSIIECLKRIIFAAFLTWLPSEGCIEVEIMTTRGIATMWIGEDEWNVFRLKGIEPQQWSEICSGIQKGTLSSSDLKGTCLFQLVKHLGIGERDYSSCFSNLLNITCPIQGEWFCYYLPGNNTLFFYENEADLSCALSKYYHIVDCEWDSMDIDCLSTWLNRYNEFGKGVPCISLGNE